MPIKDSKSKSPVKHHQNDPGAVPKKQSNEKPSQKKSEAEKQNKVKLNDAKERVKVLKSSADEIRVRIKAERAEAIHDPSIIQAEIERVRLNWEKVQSELDQAKGLSRKRKDEIDEWKTWYEKLPLAEKETGLARLQNEIKWRAAELEDNGKRINELIPQEFEARGVFEMAKLKLDAFNAGVHQLPEDKDPRLKGVLAELDKENAVVARLEPKRAERK